MSTFSSSGAFATFKANNAHLYSSSRNAFDIRQNNRFIKPKSPKSARWFSGKKLSPGQKEALSAKIKSYADGEKRSILINSMVTILVSAGILVLSSQLLNYLF